MLSHLLKNVNFPTFERLNATTRKYFIDSGEWSPRRKYARLSAHSNKFNYKFSNQTTMTKKQYQELSENFWRYGDIQVDYFLPTPSGKKMKSFGFLRGIGVGVNAESIIIASCGFRHAIHYSNVNFPKSNRNF